MKVKIRFGVGIVPVTKNSHPDYYNENMFVRKSD